MTIGKKDSGYADPSVYEAQSSGAKHARGEQCPTCGRAYAHGGMVEMPEKNDDGAAFCIALKKKGVVR